MESQYPVKHEIPLSMDTYMCVRNKMLIIETVMSLLMCKYCFHLSSYIKSDRFDFSISRLLSSSPLERVWSTSIA